MSPPTATQTTARAARSGVLLEKRSGRGRHEMSEGEDLELLDEYIDAAEALTSIYPVVRSTKTVADACPVSGKRLRNVVEFEMA